MLLVYWLWLESKKIRYTMLSLYSQVCFACNCDKRKCNVHFIFWKGRLYTKITILMTFEKDINKCTFLPLNLKMHFFKALNLNLKQKQTCYYNKKTINIKCVRHWLKKYAVFKCFFCILSPWMCSQSLYLGTIFSTHMLHQYIYIFFFFYIYQSTASSLCPCIKI